MKKKSIVLLAALTAFTAFTAILLAGCGGPSPKEPDTQQPQPPSTSTPEEQERVPEEAPASVKYEVIDNESNLPAAVRENLVFLRDKRGYFTFKPEEFDTGENVFLLIFSGEKMTGGYGIKFEALQEEKKTLRVTVTETEPAENQTVIQALTYPMLAISLNLEHEHYHISNNKGDVFSPIPAEVIPQFVEAQGVYTGQIDSNSMEVKVNGEYMAFVVPLDLSWIFAELLNTGDHIIFTYYINEHGQRIIFELNKT